MDIAPIFMHCNHTHHHTQHTQCRRTQTPPYHREYVFLRSSPACIFYSYWSLIVQCLSSTPRAICIFLHLSSSISSHLISPPPSSVSFSITPQQSQNLIYPGSPSSPHPPTSSSTPTSNKRRPFESLPPFGLHLFFSTSPSFLRQTSQVAQTALVTSVCHTYQPPTRPLYFLSFLFFSPYYSVLFTYYCLFVSFPHHSSSVEKHRTLHL